MVRSLVGKFDNRVDMDDRPPTIEESLCLVIAARLVEGGLPPEMPQAPIEAATWWLRTQEQPSQFDNPRRVQLVGGEGHRWECPYHRRLEYTLRKFFGMKPGERRVIMAAREDGVFWRGDDMWFFTKVIDETLKMRQMEIEAYRLESIRRMKQMVRRLTQDSEAVAERAAIQAE